MTSRGRQQPPSLTELSINKIVSNIERISNLQGLPEELVCLIFERVLARGKLTPRVLQVFVQTEHELLLKRVQALKVKDTPVVLPITRNPWLHEKPGWY